jgi:hypothetical protein
VARGVTQGGAVLAIGAQLVVVDAGVHRQRGDEQWADWRSAARCPDSGANVTVDRDRRLALRRQHRARRRPPSTCSVALPTVCYVTIDDSDFRSNEATTLRRRHRDQPVARGHAARNPPTACSTTTW